MKKKPIQDFIKRVWNIICLPEMKILPGQLAFFFVLSVVPIITVIAYSASFLHLSLDIITNFIVESFSADVANLIIPSITTKMTLPIVMSLIAGFYIATNGADSIIVTSNTIYNVENGNFLRRRIKAIIMTLLIVLLLIFILVAPLFGNKIIELIKMTALSDNVITKIELVIRILKGPLSWFIMFFFIKLIYTMAPDKNVPSSYTTVGALFTSILWTLITWGYSIYVTNFANYTLIYGGLANIVILMLWVYILAYVFVIGMALNNRFEMEKTGKIDLKDL